MGISNRTNLVLLATTYNIYSIPSKRYIMNTQPKLIGESQGIREVKSLISKVATTDATVLLTGESGTGKEIVARMLHWESTRRDGPFVVVNCGAIPRDLIESELFGHERGAFTGATSKRVGKFAEADGGTIFLDEIGDMPLHMQVKLLRILQERTYQRVGSNETYNVNVKVIAATHRNLSDMVEKHQFREDLYYRLSVFPINVPPLRDRPEDIPLLLNHFAETRREYSEHDIQFTAAAIESLSKCYWSGNVRELENLVIRLSILSTDGIIKYNDLSGLYSNPVESEDTVKYTKEVTNKPEIPSYESSDDLPKILYDIEKKLIVKALTRSKGNVTDAAKGLNLKRTSLFEKMKKFNIDKEKYI